jgi:anti-sigma-K factor RskA
MKSEHIIDQIESRSLNEFSDAELAKLRAHADACESCNQALAAAQLSSLLLQERAAVTFEPTPFFQTRVLARLRQRQAGNEQWSWARLWRSMGALASAMVATVAAMGALTFVIPEAPNQTNLTTANAYSPDEVMLNQGEFQSIEQGDAQVLNSLYEGEEEK